MLLPPDIYRVVLAEFLAEEDLVSLGHCASVCKKWCTMINTGTHYKMLRKAFSVLAREPGFTLFRLCSGVPCGAYLYLDFHITPLEKQSRKVDHYMIDRIALMEDMSHRQSDLCHAEAIRVVAVNGIRNGPQFYIPPIVVRPPRTVLGMATSMCEDMKNRSQCTAGVEFMRITRPEDLTPIDVFLQSNPLVNGSAHVRKGSMGGGSIWVRCAIDTSSFVDHFCQLPPGPLGRHNGVVRRSALDSLQETHHEQLRRIQQNLSVYQPTTYEKVKRLKQLRDMFLRTCIPMPYDPS